jgi:hypothetical protein
MSQYEINTIKDILELIPDDRFEAFLEELPEGLRQLKAVKMLANLAGELADAPAPRLERLVWIDDGKPGVSKVRLHAEENGKVVHIEEISLEVPA